MPLGSLKTSSEHGEARACTPVRSPQVTRGHAKLLSAGDLEDAALIKPKELHKRNTSSTTGTILSTVGRPSTGLKLLHRVQVHEGANPASTQGSASRVSGHGAAKDEDMLQRTRSCPQPSSGAKSMSRLRLRESPSPTPERYAELCSSPWRGKPRREASAVPPPWQLAYNYGSAFEASEESPGTRPVARSGGRRKVRPALSRSIIWDRLAQPKIRHVFPECQCMDSDPVQANVQGVAKDEGMLQCTPSCPQPSSGAKGVFSEASEEMQGTKPRVVKASDTPAAARGGCGGRRKVRPAFTRAKSSDDRLQVLQDVELRENRGSPLRKKLNLPPRFDHDDEGRGVPPKALVQVQCSLLHTLEAVTETHVDAVNAALLMAPASPGPFACPRSLSKRVESDPGQTNMPGQDANRPGEASWGQHTTELLSEHLPACKPTLRMKLKMAMKFSLHATNFKDAIQEWQVSQSYETPYFLGSVRADAICTLAQQRQIRVWL
jgi:hypothetical protein